MGHIKSLAIVIGTGWTIGACSFSTDALWPSLYGDELSAKSNKMDETTLQTEAAPALGTTNFVPSRVSRRPLVVIRFDQPQVEYAEALYFAVNRALERLPSATFDLVAVAPNKGDATEMTVAVSTSKRNAESVLRSLSDMGLPFDRVRLSAMISGRVSANEVHIYVR